MKLNYSILSVIILLLFCFVSCSDNQQSLERQKKLQNEFAELPNEELGVEWLLFDANTIYIGVTKDVENLELLCNIMATRGNQVINFGCHVFAVNATLYSIEDMQSRINSGDFSYMYTVTWRDGEKAK